MRRALFTAAILVLATLPVWAQRGSRMAPRFGGFTGVRPHAPVVFRGGFGFRGGFAFGGNPRVRVIVNPRPFFHHRRFFRPGFFRSGFFPGVAVYPYSPLGLYDSFSYTTQQPDYTDERETRLASEVYRLQAEVDQLRQEQRLRAEQEQYTSAAPASAPPPAPQPSAAPERQAPAAVLVYRDGHRVEAGNYAMVGETLWILSAQRARKVPLAELDLEATRKANEDRGIAFVVPSRVTAPAR